LVLCQSYVEQQFKLNEMLLEGEDLSRCAKFVSAELHDEASLKGILDDLEQFEREEQAERAGDLLCDAEGLVASQGHAEAAMPIVDLFAVVVNPFEDAHSCAAVHQRCLGVAQGPGST
jgi:hypothetical protein